MKQPNSKAAAQQIAAQLRTIAAATGYTFPQVRNWYHGHTKRIPKSALSAFQAMGLTPAPLQRTPHSQQKNFVVKRRPGRRPELMRAAGL